MDFDDDDDEDQIDDPEDPSESDMDEDDDPELIACPYCGKSIGEAADRCHHCGNYLSAEETHTRIPLWIWIGVAACLLATAMWVFLK